MKTFMVKNTTELAEAINDYNDNDTIELFPGEYFPETPTPYISIEKTLTIVGKSNDPDDIRLNCGFVVKKTLLLKNLSVNFDDESSNAVTLFDGSKFYGTNVVINHSFPNRWNTIYAKNSFISLENSEVLSTNKGNVPSIELDDSQLFADNSSIYFLTEKNSQCLLKDCFISYAICLLDHSSLSFNNLTIDADNNESYSSFYVGEHSKTTGTTFSFVKNNSEVDIFGSTFLTTNLKTDFDNIAWNFDDESNIIVDGRKLN